METILHNYETIFIVDLSNGEEATQAVIDKFKGMIEAAATIDSVETWGKRRLAYPIKDMTEGYYVLVNFKSAPEFPKELDRVYNITDGILRSIIIRKDD